MVAFAWSADIAALSQAAKVPAAEKVDLIYWLQTANVFASEHRHAQVVMRELGIQYERAIPQSMYDAWEFRGCTNVPDPLPVYLQVGKGAIE